MALELHGLILQSDVSLVQFLLLVVHPSIGMSVQRCLCSAIGLLPFLGRLLCRKYLTSNLGVHNDVNLLFYEIILLLLQFERYCIVVLFVNFNHL